MTRRGAHREDDGAGLVCLVADGDGLDRPVQRHLVDVLHPEVRSEPQRLFPHLVHQLGSGYAVAEAGVVLHLGGGHQGAAELRALEHQRGELGTRGIDRRGVAGRPGADDDHVVDSRLRSHASLSACTDTNTRVSRGVPTSSVACITDA